MVGITEMARRSDRPTQRKPAESFRVPDCGGGLDLLFRQDGRHGPGTPLGQIAIYLELPRYDGHLSIGDYTRE